MRLTPKSGRWQMIALGAILGLTLSAAAQSDSTPSSSTASSTAQKTTTTTATKKKHPTKKSSKSRGKKKRGQQAIDSTRARQIQEALIREHYLTGEPSGTWDATTQTAMQKYQADHGWQSKTTPDSRALIKLGLGPNTDHLLNPESAMTTTPAADSKPDPAKPQADPNPHQQ